MVFFKKYLYGDYGDKEAPTGGGAVKTSTNEWPLWEIFIRSKQGLDHKHVGSLVILCNRQMQMLRRVSFVVSAVPFALNLSYDHSVFALEE